MEFLKKHYEKLILSVVLLGLAVVAATLPMRVSREKEAEETRKSSLIGAAVKPFEPVDLSTNKQVLEKVKTPIKFDIAGKHNLFNPVPWVEQPNGALIKIQGNAGIEALQVQAITPLRMMLSLDEIIPTQGANNTTEYKYQVTRILEGATSGGKAGRAFSPGLTDRNIGTLKAVEGPPENPTALVMALPDRTEVRVSKEKPFSKIIGYAADLHSNIPPLDKKAAKVGETLILGNDVYTIRSVDATSVTLQDKKTQKTFLKKIASAK